MAPPERAPLVIIEGELIVIVEVTVKFIRVTVVVAATVATLDERVKLISLGTERLKSDARTRGNNTLELLSLLLH